MSEEDIIRFCSPTLAGIKPGNLFTATYDDSEQLQKELDVLANRLSAKGVKILSLRQKQGRALLYFYRPRQGKMNSFFLRTQCFFDKRFGHAYAKR